MKTPLDHCKTFVKLFSCKAAMTVMAKVMGIYSIN